MANKKFLLGILVIALVFGMTVIGCESESDDDGNKNNSGGGNGKKLTITNITGISGAVAVMIGEEGDNYVAGGSGNISNNSVTITLKNLTETYTLSGDFSGSDSYGILLWNRAIPSGGFTEEMGVPGYTTESTISFENETTTVSWASFSSY